MPKKESLIHSGDRLDFIELISSGVLNILIHEPLQKKLIDAILGT